MRGRSFVHAAAAGALALLVAACVTGPRGETRRDAALSARVDAVLARRGLGPDALSVIENVTRHDTLRPSVAPPIVSELLARPLAALAAGALFDRVVPAALRSLVDEAATAAPAPRAPAALRDLLDPYLAELADAQRELRSALPGGSFDPRELDGELPATDRLRAIAASLDRPRLEGATTRFLGATARFVRAVRAAGPLVSWPAEAVRFESAVGTVSIGTRGDDAHGPDAAVILDPGGNDTYERRALRGGVSVIVDLGGEDAYRGGDVVVHGLSAIVDVSGNDRYTMDGAGLGAAIAGVSLVVDVDGDDVYEADVFGQGAAAFGLGALVDLRGNDTYRLRAAGQGLGLPGGLGLLWDGDGDDRYVAGGLPDAFGRGGGLSLAQGAGNGVRTALGGGVGILRDDAGHDAYTAEMFAQGMGYYHGLGLLWDRAGSDRYRAVRYAQGSGVHEAAGVLRDESGDDRYELTVGVGQGMGLDLAVGVLYDGGGNDRYRARDLAQGTATANGSGLAVDTGGADRWAMGADRRAWGRAEWLRGLPSVGVLLYDPAQAVFEHDGVVVTPPPDSAALGGPFAAAPVAHEPPLVPVCRPTSPAAVASGVPLAEALRRVAPGFYGGDVDAAIDAEVRRRLMTRLQASVAELPPDDFDATWSLGEALTCALTRATAAEAAAMWIEMERVLTADPASPFAGPIARALLARPPESSGLAPMLRALDGHPRCGVRVAALRLRDAVAQDAASRSSATQAAQAALRSPCWRLQAAALEILERSGVAPDPAAVSPSFLGVPLRPR
jgi:hypothetical protein